MTKEEISILIRSLIERIEQDGEGKRRLNGVISEVEYRALREFVGLPSATTNQPSTMPIEFPMPATPQVVPVAPPQPAPPRERALNLESIGAKPPADILFCLDFGTALSKAFAFAQGRYVPLALGRRAKEEPLIYPVHSSIWIADERIFFGKRAIAESLKDTSGDRRRLDSVKQELIQGQATGSLDQVALERSFNPTSVPLTYGDVITLFLGFLTFLAGAELEANGLPRYVRRRFALPAFEPARREWGEKMLADMLARAQIIADSFGAEFLEGINVTEAKSVLDRVKDQARPDLIGEGVLEPLAAGGSRLKRDDEVRGLALVVDVGAGTTDFGLFLVVEDPEREIFKAWPIQGGNHAIPVAGDALDGALRGLLLGRAGMHPYDPTDPAHRRVNVLLSLQLRQFKEALFRDGALTFTLANGFRGTITRDEFLATPQVQGFAEGLDAGLNAILERIPHSVAEERYRVAGLSVVLTGGGAGLPMVRRLGSGTTMIHGAGFTTKLLDSVPAAIGRLGLNADYPQLAVAIGGSLPELIDEKAPLLQMPKLALGGLKLDRFPTRGV